MKQLDEIFNLIEGNGRILSMIPDESIDCIITDHPWLDRLSNKGGNRSFADYECFQYTLEDFKEKARVLKPGCFLAEFLPAENENNYEQLYQIKQYAKASGLEYYCKKAFYLSDELLIKFILPEIASKDVTPITLRKILMKEGLINTYNSESGSKSNKKKRPIYSRDGKLYYHYMTEINRERLEELTEVDFDELMEAMQGEK